MFELFSLFMDISDFILICVEVIKLSKHICFSQLIDIYRTIFWILKCLYKIKIIIGALLIDIFAQALTTRLGATSGMRPRAAMAMIGMWMM